jgi:hypothetical protein
VIEGVGGEKPYIWSVTNGGGTGFGINNEGILSGIAPRSGDYGLSLRLTDNANTQTTASFVLTVTGDIQQPLAIATESLLPTEEGNTYKAILEAVGGNGDYLWLLVNGGGSGLQLREDGALTGTAPLEGQYAITVSVTDDTRTISSTLVLVVTADSSPLTIPPSTLPGGVVGTPYAAVLRASGGELPYIWTLSEGSQSNLRLSTAGILSGIPSVSGTFGLSFRVTDGDGSVAQSSSTITVQPAPNLRATAARSDVKALPLTITTQALGAADSLSRYAAAVQAKGGKQPYNWTGRDVNSPATGLIVDPTAGSITGDFSNISEGLYSYIVTVQDADGNSDTRTFVIEVL